MSNEFLTISDVTEEEKKEILFLTINNKSEENTTEQPQVSLTEEQL